MGSEPIPLWKLWAAQLVQSMPGRLWTGSSSGSSGLPVSWASICPPSIYRSAMSRWARTSVMTRSAGPRRLRLIPTDSARLEILHRDATEILHRRATVDEGNLMVDKAGKPGGPISDLLRELNNRYPAKV